MTRLTHLTTKNFQGLDINEDLPPRLLLTGPNGSGKSARLRAIAFALLGTPGKDGLAPFTASDSASIGVSTSDGFTVERGTKIRNRAPLSVGNAARCEPSQGEKTAEAVKARIEAEIRPNVLALDLDTFFKLSGRERRRVLLDALGAGEGTAIDMQATLDSELAANAAWPRIRAAVRPMGSAQEYLVALENAAKAQASEYRAQKATAESLAKAPPIEAKGNPEELRKRLAEADSAVRALASHKAAAERGASDRARLQRESADIYARLPQALQNRSGEARLRAAQEEHETAKAARVAATENLQKATDAVKPLEARERAAKSAVSRAEGRLAAMEDLLGACTEESSCPVCGKDGFTPDAFSKQIEKDRHGLKGLMGKWTTAQASLRAAQKAKDEAAAESADAEESVRAAEASVQRCERLLKIEAALTAGDAAATAASDPGALAAAEEEQAAARDALEAATRAEGARGERQKAEANAGRADDLRRAAEAVQALVGPSGKQGDSLGRYVAELEARMADSWCRPGTLRIRLSDARGEPDAEIVLERNGATIPLASLSGGERATAIAALVAGLAGMGQDRTTVALIEAGEVDEASLVEMLKHLFVPPLSNVVVATHMPMGPAQDIKDLTGFEVRRVG